MKNDWWWVQGWVSKTFDDKHDGTSCEIGCDKHEGSLSASSGDECFWNLHECVVWVWWMRLMFHV